MRKFNLLITLLILFGTFLNLQSQNKLSNRKIDNLKNQAAQLVENDKKMTQVMIDRSLVLVSLASKNLKLRNI